jgi:hypothetical protein
MGDFDVLLRYCCVFCPALEIRLDLKRGSFRSRSTPANHLEGRDNLPLTGERI